MQMPPCCVRPLQDMRCRMQHIRDGTLDAHAAAAQLRARLAALGLARPSVPAAPAAASAAAPTAPSATASAPGAPAPPPTAALLRTSVRLLRAAPLPLVDAAAACAAAGATPAASGCAGGWPSGGGGEGERCG
eukprot:95478-Chlamydomonas_euryale.AAC.2